MNAEAAIRGATEAVVGLLVERDYAALECLTNGDRLPANQMQSAVDDYGRTLIPIPSRGWSELDVVKVDDAQPDTYDVEICLWTQEEGRSDLWLSLYLTERVGGDYDIRLMDIRVP